MLKKPKPYPSDVSDEEWEYCAPYLTLMKEHAPQRTHSMRQEYNAFVWLVRAGASWRLMPRGWVVERSFGWATTMAGYHWVAFAILMLQSLFHKS